MKIILCGYKLIGCEVLNFLIQRNHEIYVYTHESPYFIHNLREACEVNNVDFTLEKISIDNIPFKPDLICVTYYNFIIPSNVIEYCNNRIFNIHPSLLPKYRGCSSITWAIINGEKYTGFTYHYIDENIDTGRIIFQKRIKINEYDTGGSLYMKVMLSASESFEYVFDRVCDNYKGVPQNRGGQYFKRGAPYNGVISSEWNIKKIERFIRAMNYPPYPFAKFNGVEVKTISEFNKIANEK